MKTINKTIIAISISLLASSAFASPITDGVAAHDSFLASCQKANASSADAKAFRAGTLDNAGYERFKNEEFRCSELAGFHRDKIIYRHYQEKMLSAIEAGADAQKVLTNEYETASLRSVLLKNDGTMVRYDQPEIDRIKADADKRERSPQIIDLVMEKNDLKKLVEEDAGLLDVDIPMFTDRGGSWSGHNRYSFVATTSKAGTIVSFTPAGVGYLYAKPMK